MNTLTINFVQLVDGYLWLDLKTEAETRQCCYVFDAETKCWVYETGDNEPAMSSSLSSLWENGAGDAAINACLATREAQVISVNASKVMNTTILPEHEALAAAIVDKLQSMELPNVKATYEATRNAVYELATAMYKKYHIDALPAIADLFNVIFDATGNVCGSVNASFMRDILDEDGDVEDTVSCETWSDATYADIATRGVNCCHCHNFVWAETFAADVVESIERCIDDWEYTDYDTDHDSEYQDFNFWR